jgi:hypothetical protein
VLLLLAMAGCHDDDGGGEAPVGGREPAAGAAAGEGNAPQDGANGEQGDSDSGDGAEEDGAPVQPTQVEEERAVRVVIDSVLTSGEPLLACDLYVTSRYVTTSYGGRDGCNRAQGDKATADSVAIKSVRVNGAEAEAVAVPSGGASDGERLEITLIHQGGAWRVDEIHSDAPVGP